MGIGHAQTNAIGAGSLTASGARGGAQNAIEQPLVNARFDLFDAWKNSHNPHRKRIYRGQEIFNNPNVASGGRTCRGCHNAANNGQNVNGTLFDVGVSRPEFGPGKAVYTFQDRATGATVQSTDPGRGIRNGVFADLNKFKTPNIRGLASRAPYFHNGIAADHPRDHRSLRGGARLRLHRPGRGRPRGVPGGALTTLLLPFSIPPRALIR